MHDDLNQRRENDALARWRRRLGTVSRRTLIALGVVAGLLVAARVALPYGLEHFVNQRLARIPGYDGSVTGIGVSLWRGAYTLEGLEVHRREGKLREPFFHAHEIDFSLAWRELLHGRIVSDIRVDQGQLTFVAGPTAAESQTDLDQRWQDVVEALFPIDITRLEVTDGLVRYINTTHAPPVDVYVTHLHLIATGLRNRPGEGEAGEFPAHVVLEGTSLGGGRLNVQLRAEPLAEQPHFHLDLILDQVNLPALNQSLRAYANVDVGRGQLRVVAEMAGRDGGFQGYVKPFLTDLDFDNVSDEEAGLGHRVWEWLVGLAAAIVKNHPRDQVATRIPFEGRFDDPSVGVWATIRNAFHHAFVRALEPTIEHSVKADNVKPDGESVNGEDVSDNIDAKNSSSPKKQQNTP